MIFIDKAAPFHVAVKILTEKTKPEHGCSTLAPQLLTRDCSGLSFSIFFILSSFCSEADKCLELFHQLRHYPK